MNIITIFALLFVTFHDALAEEYQMLSFTMMEEEPTPYPVGSIANASRPFLKTTNYNNLVYEFFDTKYNYVFTLGDESGILFTSIVIDRETECEFKTVCELIFDVLVRSKDGQFTQPFTVNVTIEDKNDNSPRFPKPSTILEISEGSARGSTYSVDTAMDSDFGTNNSIKSYHLEPNVDSAGIFELNVTKDKDSFSLKLVLKQILNREVKDSYTVKVVAKDGGRSPNTGVMEIEVKVTDINDNPPVFTKPLYNVTVNESTPIQETIVRLSADDADDGENAKISYRIREFQENRDEIIKYFSLVESTGEIKVKSDLTQVAGQSYNFLVEAVDHGSEPQSSQTEVVVHIHDSGNNAPEVTVNLPMGYINIPESVPTGTFVISVNVIDPDSGLNGEINCEVDNQHFGIESFGGNRYKVVVSSVLDREVLDVHNVVVTCKDNGTPQMSGTVAFRVRLDDKNDNKPVFEKNLYTATVKENVDEPKIIAQVSATDADLGNNGMIQYHLHADALNNFVIDNSGVITAVAPFDREKTLAVTFRVLATDGGDTPLTGTATVVVSIDDRNDVKPKFNKTVYGFEIYENQPSGTDIDTVSAFDLDEGVNADFDFSISPDYLDRVPFVLFSNGVLKANKMLDREETSRYDFVVVVTDHGTNPQSSSAHVTVVVKDRNDNKPLLNFPNPSKNDTVTLSYPGFESKHVAQIDAYDVDENENKELEYSIQSGNDMGIFGINKDSGEVYFDSAVDIGSDQVVQLKINVSDKGSPKLSTVRDLYVELKYTNATFVEHEIEDGSNNVIIAVVVVLVTLAVSGGIIALIFFLRTRDRKQKNKKDVANDSDFGFAGSGSGSGSHTTILSVGSMSPNSSDPSRDLIKKKEVSFILDSSDSQEYHQQKLEPSLSSLPGKSSLRYQPSFTPSVHDRTSDLAPTMYDSHERLTPNTLDSRELQEKANEQLHTIKLQQVMLQNRAKQWIQQQQQQFAPVHHDDHHSETSAETVGSDSGRGGSEEDEVTSSPSADDPKTFDLSSPESQRYYLTQPTDIYENTQNIIKQSSYSKQPWSRKPHLAQRDYKNSQNNNRNNNYNFLHPDSVPNSYSSYNSDMRNSWGQQPYFNVAGPMDYTGDSALHSFFDKTPIGIPRDDDDNYSTTTSGSYTLYSEEIL